jgi:hypothetical protein
MSSRARTVRLLALAAALLVASPVAPARAAKSYTPSEAYGAVSAAYAQGGSRLDPCAFTTAELEAALRGIPPAFRTTVPALRRSIEDAIAARKRGACKGVRPTEGTIGGAAPGHVPPVTTNPSVPATTAPPVATTPSTVTTPSAPTTTAAPSPAPASTTPAQPAASGGDRTPLVVALIGVGALLLLALGLWGLARSRGWDPAWVARMRHAWGEAGFRTTSTWAEFTDWLRLGR